MSLERKLARILGGIKTSISWNWSFLEILDIVVFRFIGIARGGAVGFLGAGGHSLRAGILCSVDVGVLKPSFSSSSGTALNSPNDGLPGS